MADEPATEDINPADPDPDGADALGDPGKKALARMKADRNAANQRAAAKDARIAELEAELEKLRATPPVDVEALTADITAKVSADANQRALAAAVKTALRTRTVDADMAFSQVDLSALDAEAIDPEQIDTAIGALLESKPFLAATAGGFEGAVNDGGARKASAPDQLTRDDLKRMTPDQIVAAQAEGRLNSLLKTE